MTTLYKLEIYWWYDGELGDYRKDVYTDYFYSSDAQTVLCWAKDIYRHSNPTLNLKTDPSRYPLYYKVTEYKPLVINQEQITIDLDIMNKKIETLKSEKKRKRVYELQKERDQVVKRIKLIDEKILAK
jgi:hypothetical protein